MKKITYILLFIILSAMQLKADYWQKVESIPPAYKGNYWLDIYFLPSNPDFGWVCGFNGMTLRTTDGGQNWLGSSVSIAANLESIHFPTQNVGYTSGNAGVYKSIDGGATWTNITPAGAAGVWGNYFFDKDYGVVLAGGCQFGQDFYRTTNGGVTWDLFSVNVGETGLTDAIIYEKDGLGYAVSSGELWITLDGGRTWALHKDSGTDVWQEEITNIGNSFLFPYAGTTCGGQGADGGMRFSTDGGDTWKQYSTGKVMFGSFLINTTSGWACGNERGVYYTSDAGQTWEAKNCGIEPGDLDDIWFINPDEGWVVGDGVYKTSEDKYYATPSQLNFEDICLNGTDIDTLLLTNKSFDMSTVRMQLTGDINDFTVLINPTFDMQPCKELPVRVQFSPTSLGDKSAVLKVIFNEGTAREEEIDIVLTGSLIESSAYPNLTEIEVNPVRVGEVEKIPMIWNTENEFEEIVKILRTPLEPELYFAHNPPVKIYKGGVILYFEAAPTDTGWIESEFTFTIGPCTRDTTVTVRVYAVSPILEAEDFKIFNPICVNEIIDTIQITSSGNMPLTISDASIIDDDAEFNLLGWVDDKSYPFTIDVGESAYAIVKYTIVNNADRQGKLSIVNDDSTKSSGNKNPFIIDLVGNPKYTDISARDIVIDFGEVCLGEEAIRSTFVRNYGNLDAPGVYSQLIEEFIVDNPKSDFTINQNDSIKFDFTFKPLEAGEVVDTLYAFFEPCDDTVSIILKGTGISAELAVEPAEIIDFVKTGEPTVFEVKVIYKGNRTTLFANLKLYDVAAGWTGKILEPTGDLTINPGDTVIIKVEFTASGEGRLETEICFNLSEPCFNNVCVPFTITSSSRAISAVTDIDFGVMTCASQTLTENVTLKNQTSIQDTLTDIHLKNNLSVFELGNLPTFEYYINANKEYTFNIAFNPNDEEGLFRDTIIVETKQPGGQTIEIPVKAEFRRTRTFLISPRDGSLVHDNNFHIDHGQLEVCDSDSLMVFEFVNNGTLDDSLTVSFTGDDAFVNSTKSLNIVSMGQNTIEVYFDPSLLKQGINRAQLRLESNVCEMVIRLDFEAELIEPVLTYMPDDEVVFDNLWVGNDYEQEVIVRNKSVVPKTITKASFKNNTPGISHDLNTPVTIQVDDEITFKIKFTADIDGTFSDKLVFEEQSSCIITEDIDVLATVPVEQYNVDFRLDHHLVQLGDTVTVNVELLNTEQRFNTDKFAFEFTFNKHLLFPQKLEVRNSTDKYEKTQFSYEEGVLSFETDPEISKDLLKEKGVIAKMEFLTLANIPDKTSVVLSDLNTFTDNGFRYTKEDGSVQIEGYCIDEVLFTYQMFPSYDASLSEVSDGSTVDISINSTGTQTLSIRFTDILGNEVYEKSYELTKGQRNIEINSQELNSGTYFIKMNSNYGIIRQGKVVIVN